MKRTAILRARPDADYASVAVRKEGKPAKGPRTVKCGLRGCLHRFVLDPATPRVKWCSLDCGALMAIAAGEARKAKLAKADRAATKAKKAALLTRADHAVPAQKAVNKYVNLRDRDKPCVSCGKPAEAGGVRNASHFKSVGSNSALRFHLWNIHTSCYRCNVELSGNLGEYYPRLVERIGAEKVEWMQNAKRERRYEIDELQRITRVFTKKAKRLTSRGNNN